MKIDAQKVIQFRQSKAWSQQHLADVSGLSLRTIQRIEKTQAASQDSVKALASAFNVTPDSLFQTVVSGAPKSAHPSNTEAKKYLLIGLGALSSLIIAYWSQTVVATNAGVQEVQPTAHNQASNSEHESIEDAMSWLSIVDAYDYASSWQHSDALFQRQVSEDKWTEALNSVRKPLGDSLSRTHAMTQLMSSMPGLPDGDYVVLTFNSQFENKTKSVETLTLNLDEDTWKPIGYFIR